VSFLDNRVFAVDIRGHLSGLRQIRAGVPQESVLGPFLYTIYTSDLPNLVAHGTIHAKVRLFKAIALPTLNWGITRWGTA